MTFSTRAGVLGAREQILGFCFVDWKKHNLKVENYILFRDITEDYSSGRQPLR